MIVMMIAITPSLKASSRPVPMLVRLPRQRERHHRVALLEAEQGIAARGHGDDLTASGPIGDRRGIHAGLALPRPETASAARGERREDSPAPPPEHQPPRRREPAPHPRLRRPPPPAPRAL